MKALVFDGKLTLKDLPVPEPAPGEALSEGSHRGDLQHGR